MDDFQEGNTLSEKFYNVIKDSTLLVCIGATVLMSVVVWLRLLTRKARPVYFFLILIISYLAGLTLRHYDKEAALYDEAYDITSTIAIELCCPIFLFYSSMGTDFSELSVNAALTILSLLGFSILVALISAFLAWPFLQFSSNINFTTSFLMMLMLTPKWAAAAVLELDGVQGHIRDTQMMLKFEQLCSTWLAYVLTELTFKWQLLQSWPHFRMYQFIAVILYKCLGFIIGAFFGLLIRIPFSFAYNDISAQAIIIISSIYLVQLLSVILDTSPGLAVGIFAVSLNSNKVKMSKDAEEFHAQLWEWYIFLAETATAILAGIILGMKRPQIIQLYHYGIIIMIYCMLLAIRLGIITLSRIVCGQEQNDLYWKRVVIMGVAPYQGYVCVLLALQYFTYDENRGFQNITYVIGVVALSVFFNAMLFKAVLSILGMFEYKRATIVNMNVAVGQINTCRDRAIFSQKMDLVISDANWGIVENLTRLPHPYRRKLMETGYSEDKGDFRLRTIICSSCGIEVAAPPTKGEIEDMIIEAKQRVLKIQLVSFGQQYESGTISRHSYRTLFSVIDSAASSGNPTIDSTPLNIRIQESKGTRFFRKLFTFLTAVTSRTYVFVPENLFRLMAYRLTTSRSFNIILAFLALTDTAIIIRLIMIWLVAPEKDGYKQFSDADLQYGRVAQILDIVFFAIFSFEFIIQLAGLGLIQYFSSNLNKVEMGANLARTAELIMYFNTATRLGDFVSVLLVEDIILWMKCLLLVRIVRVYVFVVGWLPRCLAMVEKQVEEELMKNYEVGKGYLVSLDRVMKFLSHVAIYETVYEAIKTEIETERRKVAKNLGLIQKEHPSIAITVKTRHAIRFVINSVADCMNDLKEDGILDFNENKAMNNSLEKVKNDLRELPMVDPSLAQSVLKEISWLVQDESQAEIILEAAKLTSYDYNDRIINVGDDPVGLYVLVSGLVKAYYNPTQITAQLNAKFGVLPNYDFFEVLRFDQPQDSYVVAGNVIGEIGAVSGRRYDMTVTCETSVQLYFIPWAILKSIVHDSPQSIEIQSAIWKCIGIRLALVLVHSKPPYTDWPKEKLLAHLENGWVPPLTLIKCLNIHEDIADMILIEGVCKDAASNKVFHGPAHLPKGIHLLLLPDHPKWDFQTVYTTKMLIIPSTQNLNNIVTHLFKDHYTVNAHTDHNFKDSKRVGFGSEDKSITSVHSTLTPLQSTASEHLQ